MNTMDEVIKALECCELSSMCSMCESCPYTGIGNCNVEIQEDALHYLKKYREEYKALIKAINEAIDVEMKYYDMIEELERNSPLTWNELKKMEGKPVWIEHDSSSTKYQRWVLVCEYTDANKITIIANHLLTQIMPDEYGKTWQAYRKERK